MNKRPSSNYPGTRLLVAGKFATLSFFDFDSCQSSVVLSNVENGTKTYLGTYGMARLHADADKVTRPFGFGMGP